MAYQAGTDSYVPGQGGGGGRGGGQGENLQVTEIPYLLAAALKI